MGAKILIIEDEAAIRESLSDLLELSEFNCVSAVNGIEGIAAASKESPDLIICDVMMPQMNGFQVLEHLRNSEKNRLTPIIMLTAKVELESKLRGLELGADDYITKPFEFKILVLKIANLIQKHRELQANNYTNYNFESQEEVFKRKLNLILDENIENSNLTVEELASMMNMSPATFNRKLKAHLGTTPNQYSKEFKLNRAKEMIQLNFGSISEIAVKTGFHNQAYFSTLYKDYFGHSPSEEMNN